MFVHFVHFVHFNGWKTVSKLYNRHSSSLCESSIDRFGRNLRIPKYDSRIKFCCSDSLIWFRTSLEFATTTKNVFWGRVNEIYPLLRGQKTKVFGLNADRWNFTGSWFAGGMT